MLMGIWLVPGFLQCVQELTWSHTRGGGEARIGFILLYFLPLWLPWAAFTPLVLALARRFSFQRTPRLAFLLTHVVACVGFGLLHLVLIGLFKITFPPRDSVPTELWPWLVRMLWSLHSQAEVLAYFGVVAVGHALSALRASREREVRALKLEGQLAEARLAVLQGQLRPHFLFNTLNSIDVMMKSDVKGASDMLHRLSGLLRRTLRSEAPTHSLREELEHLRCYIDIESVRFSDRLEVSFEVEEASLPLDVPTFILQPLVENSISHGILPYAERGTVVVRAKCSDDRLEIEIEDDGVGVVAKITEGIGIGNTRVSLNELYGDDHSFTVEPRTGRGTVVSISLPRRTADQSRPEFRDE